MKLKFIASILSLLAMSGCTFVPANEGAKLRSVEENNAITDSWYPIQSKECQLLVDSFGLMRVAMGNPDSQSLLDNMEKIKSNLETTALVVSRSLLELSQITLEPSIKKYALEAIPIFAQLGDLIVEDAGGFSFQVEYLNRMYELTGKVPDACKS